MRQSVELGYVIRQRTSKEELELRLGEYHFGDMRQVQQEGSVDVLIKL